MRKEWILIVMLATYPMSDGEAARVVRHAIGAGGGVVSTPSYMLQLTLGEPGMGASRSDSVSVSSGFWGWLGSPPIVPVRETPPPLVFRFRANVPNPFMTATRFAFELPAQTHVTLDIYDVKGRLVRRILNEKRVAGIHSTIWDARDGGGRRMSSGVYVARFAAGSFESRRKIVLLR
jgi:hypothetical protein